MTELITIRKAIPTDAAGIANVHINSWREAYAKLIPEDYLSDLPLNFNNRYRLWQELIPKTEQIIYVADHKNHGIVGFANGGVGKDKGFEDYGEIYAIYLLKKIHGTGTGAKLLTSVFSDLKQRNLQKAYLWVIKDNPTISFYERMGAKFSGDIDKDTITGKETEDLRYVWDSILGLLPSD